MISIVTITFNNYDELIKTLNSIQGVKNIESVVVNGGTCIKTKEYLSTYSGVAITEKDDGISDAFNKGIKLSNGDAIMFLNSGDTLLDKEYIDWANLEFEKNKKMDFVYSDIKISHPQMGVVDIDTSDSHVRSIAKGMPYPHQTMIVKKDVFLKVGLFKKNLRFAMDFDLVLRMKKNNLQGTRYPHVTVLMDGAGVSSNNNERVLAEIIHVIKLNNANSVGVGTRLLISSLIISAKKLVTRLGLKKLENWIYKNKNKINL